MSTPTPAQLGYRFPAEWEPHASTWVSWPRNPATWPDHFEPVPEEFAKFVRTIAQFEPCNILAGGEAVFAQAKSLVGDVANVHLHDIPTNDAWCRDHGPTFLVGERTSSGNRALPAALVDWEYNAWGGKYPPFDLDNQVPKRIAALQKRQVFSPGIILEGGAIDGDGVGTILTTRSCLLNPNRNPQLGQTEIEKYLHDNLAAKRVLWLSGGDFAGDDTDGHIDQLARFVTPTTIVVSVCDDPEDENYGSTQQTLAEVQALTDADGKSYNVVPLFLPQPKFVDEQRVPAGYCNFIFVNGGVIVPQFDDPADQKAIEALQGLLPHLRVVGSPSLNLIWGLGSFHCLSQQEPAL